MIAAANPLAASRSSRCAELWPLSQSNTATCVWIAYLLLRVNSSKVNGVHAEPSFVPTLWSIRSIRKSAPAYSFGVQEVLIELAPRETVILVGSPQFEPRPTYLISSTEQNFKGSWTVCICIPSSVWGAPGVSLESDRTPTGLRYRGMR